MSTHVDVTNIRIVISNVYHLVFLFTFGAGTFLIRTLDSLDPWKCRIVFRKLVDHMHVFLFASIDLCLQYACISTVDVF